MKANERTSSVENHIPGSLRIYYPEIPVLLIKIIITKEPLTVPLRQI
jgi:hypothetical protein